MANFYQDNEALRYYLHHPLMKEIVALRERDFSESSQFDYAPLDYADAMDSYERVLDIVGEICGDIVAPNAEGVDKEGPHHADGRVRYASGTERNLKALVQAGLMGITLPRQYGGMNFSLVPYTMSADLVSRADASFVNVWGLQDCAETINEFALKFCVSTMRMPYKLLSFLSFLSSNPKSWRLGVRQKKLLFM
ncbi:MAG: acyl-CoA dehydrogenase family protein [Muribaculaceae bacterium]|nr:acyl-CoA dehydrogenase family protein [Muribaculaceae bacterium]